MNADQPPDADAASDGPLYAEDLARRAVGERLAEVLEQLRNVRAGHDDPETIHQLRVWSRRSEAAIDVFAPFASPRRAKWVRKRLKKIRRAAGDARDADALAHRWMKLAGEEPVAGWKKLLTKVDRERKATRRDVKKLARQYGQKDFGPRARAFLKRIHERRAEPKTEESDGSAESFALQTIAAAGKAFWKDEPVVLRNIDDLHAFRIRGKKLRYTIEACRPALPEAAVEACLTELTALQDRLGKINDRASALTRLEKWRDEAKHPAAIARLNKLMADEQVDMDARVAGLADWWNSDRRSSLREKLFVLSSPRGRRSESDESDSPAPAAPSGPTPRRWPIPFWYEADDEDDAPSAGDAPSGGDATRGNAATPDAVSAASTSLPPHPSENDEPTPPTSDAPHDDEPRDEAEGENAAESPPDEPRPDEPSPG